MTVMHHTTPKISPTTLFSDPAVPSPSAVLGATSDGNEPGWIIVETASQSFGGGAVEPGVKVDDGSKQTLKWGYGIGALFLTPLFCFVLFCFVFSTAHDFASTYLTSLATCYRCRHSLTPPRVPSLVTIDAPSPPFSLCLLGEQACQRPIRRCCYPPPTTAVRPR
jgi:hypothetical protein